MDKAQERPIRIRFARQGDLSRVNELRKQVNDVHAAGKPEIFKSEFSQELRDRIFAVWNDPDRRILLAEVDGVAAGFAHLHCVNRSETPYAVARTFLDIEEFGVDAAYRRQGVATALIDYIRAFAKHNGFHRLELNMWEFNQGALAFYEAVGFSTYRRFMEMDLD